MGIRMDSLPPRYQKQAARKLDPVAYEKALQFFHAEESAKNPARQAQGSISRATGEGFEAQILTACAYYRAHGIAEIDKTPEPIKVISGRHQNPSGCWSFEAVFTKQAQPDFQGTLCGGSSVVFEAKATGQRPHHAKCGHGRAGACTGIARQYGRAGVCAGVPARARSVSCHVGGLAEHERTIRP